MDPVKSGKGEKGKRNEKPPVPVTLELEPPSALHSFLLYF
jgi:hypothetical protein